MHRWMVGPVLLILTLAAACGGGASPEAVPGVTDDTVRVGMTTDLTGPIAFVGQEISAGAKLFFQLANDQGGVQGRKIELLLEDDGYQPARTIAAYRKLLDRDQVFAFVGNLGTAPTMALKPMVERDRVPVVPAGTFSSTVYTPASRYVFGLDPSYRVTSWVMLEYVADTLKATDAKIGVIYQDDDLGLDGLKGLRDAAAHYGLTIVAEEGHKRGAVDFTSQVLNVKKAGATHVVLWTILRETAAILKKAQEIGWEPEFLSWPAAAEQHLLNLAGDAAKNLHVVNILDTESDRPQWRKYLDAIAKYDAGHATGFYHATGFVAAQAFAEALERAGSEPTREKLVDALETFDHWDDNAMALTLSYGPGLRGGATARTFISKVEQGKLVRVSEDRIFEMPEL